MDRSKLTPTQRRIFDLLNDGQPHAKEQLKALLPDDQAVPNALAMHITKMRPILGPYGLHIVCNFRTGTYQLTRTLSSPYTGYT